MHAAPRRPEGRRDLLRRSLALLLAAAGATPRGRAQGGAPGVELTRLALQREGDALTVEFNARVTLSRAVEDALRRGVPVYFVAEATLYRSRWYWRDERIARVRRVWRVAFQPLTAAWRVALGGLGQSYGSLGEALAATSSASGWALASMADLDADAIHYLRFRYELDATRLPGPMQIGIEGRPGWVLRAERELPLD
ncbi:MAG TPA: DUF4390 domain-containing protein [Rubrivivax sp.]|jgi:hypothetical protein|nr:DUF4390 domain-containing protein [Rhodoferax sp.]MCL4736871.1 DUF4390 domain-containing protein [Burkholderiaceae bacterium]MCP5289531.1 DUF4390 domain-containing protein [Burkholderiaceae bacterium]HMQ72851.1 DUF4390 domain-containing protein [Rubrivivax sp.]HMR69234.1 DUF4390 domain-containing protein [Rubrivivax sp.]